MECNLLLLVLLQLLPDRLVLLVAVLCVGGDLGLAGLTHVPAAHLQLAARHVGPRLAAGLTLDHLVLGAGPAELSAVRTGAEQGVTPPVHVEHVIKPVEVRVLRHLPLGIRVRNVDAALLHLLVELIFVIAGWTLESGLAGLKRCLLDTVAMVGAATAGRDQLTGARTRHLATRLETDHAGGVWGQIGRLGLTGSVGEAVAVHVVQEYVHMLARLLTEGPARKMVVLLTTFSKHEVGND